MPEIVYPQQFPPTSMHLQQPVLEQQQQQLAPAVQQQFLQQPAQQQQQSKLREFFTKDLTLKFAVKLQAVILILFYYFNSPPPFFIPLIFFAAIACLLIGLARKNFILTGIFALFSGASLYYVVNVLFSNGYRMGSHESALLGACATLLLISTFSTILKTIKFAKLWRRSRMASLLPEHIPSAAPVTASVHDNNVYAYSNASIAVPQPVLGMIPAPQQFNNNNAAQMSATPSVQPSAPVSAPFVPSPQFFQAAQQQYVPFVPVVRNQVTAQ